MEVARLQMPPRQLLSARWFRIGSTE